MKCFIVYFRDCRLKVQATFGMNRSLTYLLFSLFLGACGGGGGGASGTNANTPSNPDATYSLSGLKNFTAGSIYYSSRVRGKDELGNTYSGSVSIVNRPKEMLNGVLVIPREELWVYSDKSSTFTSYFDEAGYLQKYVCNSVDLYQIPDTVKIGDFGLLGGLDCQYYLGVTDGVADTDFQWRIEDGMNGSINFALTFSNGHPRTYKMKDGNIVGAKITLGICRVYILNSCRESGEIKLETY